MADVRPIAFYLPQYHPIPENDAWWGRGFTEWTSVVKGKPLFPGHYQPRLPADLGFYDLRLPEVRQAQAQLAREYGISGFCYYHYWFHGKLLLDRPFREVLSSGEPDFPFCLCWANENWTRRWDGLDHQVLIAQQYSVEDDREHIRWLTGAFRDRRYIRIDGRPLFLIYRVSRLPDPAQTAAVWREEARRMGIGELYLCTVESLPDSRIDPRRVGFDAAVEFQPDWVNLGPPVHRIAENSAVYDYGSVVDRMLKKTHAPYTRFPCVTPGWDNTPRRIREAGILRDSTPERYETWLREVIKGFLPSRPQERLVFVNAWNEWGEGAHLEPCQRWGRAYLEATRRALDTSKTELSRTRRAAGSFPPHAASAARISVCIPTYNGAKYLAEAIASVLNQTLTDFELIIVDDCSTDGTEAVAKSFTDERIKHFKNPVRLGLVGNWNRCIELARGQYVCVFHQDDVMMPDNLDEKVQLLDKNPAVGMVYSNVHQVGAGGELISEYWYFKPEPEDEGVHKGLDYLRRLLTGVNIVCCPGVVVRREAFETLGGFDGQLPFTADWEMWMRIAAFYDVGYRVKALVSYRRHEANETWKFLGAKELEHAYRAKMLALEKFGDRIPDAEALRSRIAREYRDRALERATQCQREHDHEEAWRYLNVAKEAGATGPARQADADHVLSQELRRCCRQALLNLPSEGAANGHQALCTLRGEGAARVIPTKALIEAACYKVAASPGFGWLYRFRGLGRRLLGE
jgi:glycosyltransferase involved in cell wall biosynthesis